MKTHALARRQLLGALERLLPGLRREGRRVLIFSLRFEPPYSEDRRTTSMRTSSNQLALRVQAEDVSKARKKSQGLRRPYHRTVTALPGKPGTPLLWEPKARTQAQMTT